MKRSLHAAVLGAVLAAPLLAAQPPEELDLATLARIREEALTRSQVMDHVSWLADVYGPRVTGSPAISQAAQWAMARLARWGVRNVHQERWSFGRGWSLERFAAHMVSPQVQPIIGFPHTWSPGTNGPVIADVVLTSIASQADFAKYQGTLKGKIVLTQPARPVKMLEGKIVLRMTDEDLSEAMTTPVSPPPTSRPTRVPGELSLQEATAQFYYREGVVATFDRGSDSVVSSGGSDLPWETMRTDGGTIFPGSSNRNRPPETRVPAVTLAVEHYNRMVRVLEKGVPVKVELNLQTRFHAETDKNGFNIVGEIAGTDLADEIVLIGAHFDSTQGATGATDNATGSAVMMETMRILKAVGATPRRTVRIALWGGEEEGLLGSRAYVREHFGDPGTMQLKPDHEKLSVYFNDDNGTGRVRGIWAQDNLAAAKIFAGWVAPLADLGVSTVGPRSVTATDHVSFDAIGLPAFQFMHDRLEYNSRTHHSNMDVVDRVQRDEVVQTAAVVASFTYNAAMRNDRFPRKPLPKLTRPTLH